MVYQGQTYEKKFGTLVRKLDREQAIINENQRDKYFEQRAAQLEKTYERLQGRDHDKDVRDIVARYCEYFPKGLNAAQENQKQNEIKRVQNRDDWHEYEERMEAQIIREWKKFGKRDRDWVKYKVIFFDHKENPKAMQTDKYRKMMRDQQKEAMQP